MKTPITSFLFLLSALTISVAAAGEKISPATLETAAPASMPGGHILTPTIAPRAKPEAWFHLEPMLWNAQEGMWEAQRAQLSLRDGTLTMKARGEWGDTEPGMPLLCLTAGATGVYTISGKVSATRESGSGGCKLIITAFREDGEDDGNGRSVRIVEKQRKEAETVEWKSPDGLTDAPAVYPWQVLAIPFRLKQYQQVPLDAGVYLKKGERFALSVGYGSQTKGTIEIQDFSISFAAAETAPANFVDGVRPPEPLPPTNEPTLDVTVRGEIVEYPADAGLRSVKDYGAKGDGATDDTRAINRALETSGMVFLPPGTYVISDQLRFQAGRPPKRTMLMGAGVGRSIIKLRNGSQEFSDAKEPLAMLWVSKDPEQAFRNHVRDLTFHSGTNNPGAIGVQFYANNQGSLESVEIISGDGAGAIGLDLGFARGQGPCFIGDVWVEGFDFGVSTAQVTTVTTFENIHVSGQRKAGFVNHSHCVALRGFTSKNSVSAFVNRDPAAHAVVLDANLVGEGGSEPAILNEGVMLLRNVTVEGYGVSLVNSAKDGSPAPTGMRIDEWVSHAPVTVGGQPGKTLGLAVKETPTLPWSDPQKWVSVRAYQPKPQAARAAEEATPAESDPDADVDDAMEEETDDEPVKKQPSRKKGKDDDLDWGPAIQEAIDSGAETVYFPGGEKAVYPVSSEIIVRGKTARLAGMECSFTEGDYAPQVDIVIGDGEAPVVFLERFGWGYSNVVIRHNSSRPLVISNVTGARYIAGPNAGPVYFKDVVQKGLIFRPGQKVWARQLNPEYGTQPKIINSGADLWVLGLKTEGNSTLVVTRDGGRTEILGGLAYANQAREHDPMFILLSGGSLSVSLGEWMLKGYHFEELLAAEGSEGMQTVSADDVPPRGDPASDVPIGFYGQAASIPLITGQAAKP